MRAVVHLATLPRQDRETVPVPAGRPGVLTDFRPLGFIQPPLAALFRVVTHSSQARNRAAGAQSAVTHINSHLPRSPSSVRLDNCLPP